ncbi:MAG: PEFG-CTERM sorting domain-containing protein [Thaumarchaeota archaeon]|nr:PEFG-CTERM sorting domain-containing protein [Nitrososphaerota archaeon]
MNYILFSMMAIVTLSAILVPSSAQTLEPIHFEVKNPNGPETYDVIYTMNGGTIKDITVDAQNLLLLINLETTEDGTLTITLPRNLVDAKMGDQDDQFFVLADGELIDFEESKTDTDRTLKIPLTYGIETIDISGTQIVPEFGSLSTIILTVGIIGVIATSLMTRTKF